MHGREKSDPAIVVLKPANKAGQPAAERVERRAGAEGNAGQHNTRRAQDRVSVSQALDRIRQAARQRRKERFTSLSHHINVPMLRTAFFALKRDKPETFTFLGFTYICGKSRRGKFLLRRKSRRDRLQAKLAAVKEDMRRRMHQPIPRQGEWLRQVVTGYFAYHAVPTNIRTLQTFRDCVVKLWRRSLRRRGQRDKTTWERVTRLADDYPPKPRILHPWPNARFAVKYPRWEPYARIGPVRFCAGGAQ